MKTQLLIWLFFLLMQFSIACKIETENKKNTYGKGVIIKEQVVPFVSSNLETTESLQKLYRGTRFPIIEERDKMVKIGYPDRYILKTEFSRIVKIINGEEFEINLKIGNRPFRKLRSLNSTKNGKKKSAIFALSYHEERPLFEYEFRNNEFEYPSHRIINIFDINKDGNDDFIVFLREHEGSRKLLIFLSKGSRYKQYDFLAIAKNMLKIKYDLTYWEDCIIGIDTIKNIINIKYGNDVSSEDMKKANFTFKENHWDLLTPSLF